MSVEDETWDRPICKYCHREISYGQKLTHKNGICIKFMKKTHQPVGGEESILESIMPTHTVNMSENTKWGRELRKVADDDVVDLNICLAADDIITIFEKQGFTTDSPPDIELLRHLIVETIQKRMKVTESLYTLL